jgi:hypothetical protein
MNMRLNVKKVGNKWAAFCGKKYYVATLRDTELDAKIARLHQIGIEAQDRIDDVDHQLEALGALDHKDPHGYLA